MAGSQINIDIVALQNFAEQFNRFSMDVSREMGKVRSTLSDKMDKFDGIQAKMYRKEEQTKIKCDNVKAELDVLQQQLAKLEEDESRGRNKFPNPMIFVLRTRVAEKRREFNKCKKEHEMWKDKKEKCDAIVANCKSQKAAFDNYERQASQSFSESTSEAARTLKALSGHLENYAGVRPPSPPASSPLVLGNRTPTKRPPPPNNMDSNRPRWFV